MSDKLQFVAEPRQAKAWGHSIAVRFSTPATNNSSTRRLDNIPFIVVCPLMLYAARSPGANLELCAFLFY